VSLAALARRPRFLLALAFVVSLVATVWSVSLSGIGPTGWRGLGLFPCELCWYQRVLMYPLPVLLGVALLRKDDRAALYALPLAVPGFLVAAYHVLIQSRPSLETSRCFVGSCTSVDWRFMDALTIPQLSLLAFALVIALGAGSLLVASRRP
jgi:disulfide bond formation protein DsbB